MTIGYPGQKMALAHKQNPRLYLGTCINEYLALDRREIAGTRQEWTTHPGRALDYAYQKTLVQAKKRLASDLFPWAIVLVVARYEKGHIESSVRKANLLGRPDQEETLVTAKFPWDSRAGGSIEIYSEMTESELVGSMKRLGRPKFDVFEERVGSLDNFVRDHCVPWHATYERGILEKNLAELDKIRKRKLVVA